MGKSTSMAIFNSYVKLPGIRWMLGFVMFFFHVSSTDILMMFDDLWDFGDSGEVLSTLAHLGCDKGATTRLWVSLNHASTGWAQNGGVMDDNQRLENQY